MQKKKKKSKNLIQISLHSEAISNFIKTGLFYLGGVSES